MLDSARKVIRFILNPGFLHEMASYDVGSTVYQSLRGGAPAGDVRSRGLQMKLITSCEIWCLLVSSYAPGLRESWVPPYTRG